MLRENVSRSSLRGCTRLIVFLISNPICDGNLRDSTPNDIGLHLAFIKAILTAHSSSLGSLCPYDFLMLLERLLKILRAHDERLHDRMRHHLLIDIRIVVRTTTRNTVWTGLSAVALGKLIA